MRVEKSRAMVKVRALARSVRTVDWALDMDSICSSTDMSID